ncbi:VOC family protein [Saccharospirillum salsuginis]|uniref:Extradiol dioxygenase n=1 Tax=Saccharospirillum salsuginis TaxID=418750 RepID=A0A918K490_9GAMM|nr:VOC family protein [Saccharospirillum salsuginis]GGX43465.1 extradiol dioxygenase [Saccharospirillum salsuginis]
MVKQVFVNLPVGDLQASIRFFTQLGFRFDPNFTDDTATCMLVTDHIMVMLLNREKFQGFSPNPISDASQQTEVMIALAMDDRREVDDLVAKAVAAGGSTYNEPQDHGFMYGHGFQDLDGHVWEVFYMDQAALPAEGAE